jgi:multidrug efflux pump subunit AcrA (membrane-fusion protein)
LKKQQLVAIVIFIAVVAWMLVPREGISTAGEAKPDVVVTAAPEGSYAGEGLETPLVRTLAVSEEDYTQQIRIRGRTQAFRHVMVRAEEPGKLSASLSLVAHASLRVMFSANLQSTPATPT